MFRDIESHTRVKPAQDVVLALWLAIVFFDPYVSAASLDVDRGVFQAIQLRMDCYTRLFLRAPAGERQVTSASCLLRRQLQKRFSCVLELAVRILRQCLRHV